MKINKQNFAEALSRAAQVADKKSTMPVLSCVLLQTVGGKLTVAAQDLTVSVTSSVDAEFSKELFVAVDARKLLDRVKMMPDGLLTITEKGGAITIKGESSRKYVLQTTPGEEFPSLPTPQDSSPIELSGETLSLLLSQVAYAVSDDETRPHLASALLECSDDTVTMVGTDGHRLAVSSAPFEGAYRGNLLVPVRAVDILRKTLDGSDVTIEQSGPDLFLDFGTYAYSVKLVDASFVPYQQVIPTTRQELVKSDARSLVSALKAVALASSSLTGGIKLTIAEDAIKLSVESPEAGAATDCVPAVSTGTAESIGINAQYLIDALGAVTGEEVEIGFKGELDPVTVRSGDYLCVVMPMRV